MIVRLLGSENLNASIVGIADERRETVRLRVGGDELAHPFETRPAFGPRLVAAPRQKQVRGQETLQHQPVVGRRQLEVDAVSRGLVEDFLFDDRTAERQPSARRSRALEEAAEEDEPDAVAQVVVAVQVRLFEMTNDELAVQIERAKEAAAKAAVAARGGAGEEMKSPDPADRTQRDVHRARPVDA